MIWLKRFAKHPTNHLTLEPVRQLPDPNRLDQLLFSNIREISTYLEWLDRIIIKWAQSITESDLDGPHHRGQVTTLLSQAGVDVGDRPTEVTHCGGVVGTVGKQEGASGKEGLAVGLAPFTRPTVAGSAPRRPIWGLIWPALEVGRIEIVAPYGDHGVLNLDRYW